MNGLKASPRGSICLALRVTAPLQLVGASKCAAKYDKDNGKCDDEEDSLEGLAERGDECDNLPSEEIKSGAANLNGDYVKIREAAEIDRDVHTFFDQFLPHPTSPQKNQPLQPITVLQSRYNTLQHQINKQAQDKSIKGWFRYESSGKSNDAWWTSEIVVPGDMAEMWGLKSVVHRSGQLQLTQSEMEDLKERNVGKDLLLDLCGKFKISTTNMIQFKLKKGAQKSAALNLLLAIDLGDLPNVECDLKRNGQPPNEVDKGQTSNNGDNIPIPKERFHLESIEYCGAVKHSEAEADFLSSDNPCMVQCIVSVKDNRCNDMDQAVLEVKSGFHHKRHDSLKATFDKLGPALKDRGAADDDVNNVLSSIKESEPPNTAYEITLPKWATAKVQSRLYLYELEFSVCKEGSDACTPLSEAMGLDVTAATRIGILCGRDLYEGQKHFAKTICADFTPTSPLCTGSSSKVRVRMCRRVQVTLSEMGQQLKRALPKIDLEIGEDPISLAKCFNIILFDHGQSYGQGPKLIWGELLKRLVDDTAEPDNRRTYMFLPLHGSMPNLETNWPLVWDVVHHKPTCVLSLSGWGLPTTFFKQISLGLSLGASTACAISIFFSLAGCYADWDHLSLERAILFAFSIWTAISISKTIPTSLLRNRFLSQPVGFRGRIFIAKNESPASTISLAPLWHILQSMFRDLYTNYRLSNMKHYKHLLQCYVRHPMEPLIPALLLKGLTYPHQELSLFNEIYGVAFFIPKTKPPPHNSISNSLAESGLLVPELTQTLPMPRDMLYLCRHASNFMPKLERAYTLTFVSSRLREVQHNTGNCLRYKTVPNDNLSPIIDRATSIHNSNTTEGFLFREHERLEALGDSILLFFIVLNLFAKQSSSDTEYVLDLFEQEIVLQGKNKVLFKAAMQVGLHRLVHVGNVSSTKLWRSMYTTTTNEPLTAQTQTIELSRKQLSDIVESVLGATYLLDPSGCMTLGFLGEIGSCLPNFEEFAGKGTCLTEGYPLDGHPRWAVALSKIGIVLQQKQNILLTLRRKATEFCCLLTKQGNRQEQMKMLQSDPTASLLLHCALFDDSLDNEEIDPETMGLESLAKLRDKIFHVGNAALQLSIISELYHLHPTSTSGDIHLMKVVLMSHDSLAYIVVKNGFHECLFDAHADAPILMQEYMEESDLLGAMEWAKHDGWMIPGGLGEFRKRIRRHFGNDVICPEEMLRPRYTGLAAGRLWGHKRKLKEKVTDDLQFSMKCIVGALALTFGARDAWEMLRPFFSELMLLSPEELRTSYNGVSDLASNYKKGKK